VRASTCLENIETWNCHELKIFGGKSLGKGKVGEMLQRFNDDWNIVQFEPNYLGQTSDYYSDRVSVSGLLWFEIPCSCICWSL